MAKPTLDDTRWAEDSGGTPSADLSAPSSGKKDIGWQPAEEPPCEEMNFWQRAVHAWAKWLSGTGFGDGKFYLGASGAALPSASAPVYTVNDGTGDASWTFASGNRLAIPADLPRVGNVVKGFSVRADTTGGSDTLDGKLWKRNGTGAPTQLGSTVTHAGTTTEQSHTLASPYTVAAGDAFFITVRCNGGTTSILYDVSLTFGWA